jgi:general L-amino acid transport system permease protein
MRALVKRSVASPLDAVITAVVSVVMLLVAIPLVRWGLVDARWIGTAEHCRAAGGACWTFVGHKLSFMIFGLYPPNERWRPAMALAILLALIVATAMPRCWRRGLIVAWLAGLTVTFWLMKGGAGLVPVATRLWGGLPVTVMLTALGLALGFPLAVVLALARRSRWSVARTFATAFVETVRGVPLIAVLYVAALVIPLAMPRGVEVDKLALAQLAVVAFASAYLSEAVRSGLQLVPRGQYDAARALGLSAWRVHRLVILPQALRTVVPSFVSIAVGFFQDTSLVVIIGLFDLLNTARVAAQDPAWLGFHTEAFVFVGAIYFIGSTVLSQYGLRVERRLSRRDGDRPERVA